MPTRRFDGATLEDALAQVRATLGADARITGAEKVRQGGIGGFFAKERVEVTVDVDEPVAATNGHGHVPAATQTPVAPRPKPQPTSLLDLADSISDEEQGASASSPSSTSTEGGTFASVLERITTEADAAVEAQTALDPEPTPAPAPQRLGDSRAIEQSIAQTPSPSAVASRVRRAAPPEAAKLTKLGVPASMLPPDLSHGLHCALVDAMARLPEAPAVPAGHGTVFAVVGDRNDALAIARDVSADLDLDAEDVVLCVPRRRGRNTQVWLELSRAADAEEHRRSWRWRMHPTVVVVDAPVGRDATWTRSMLAALEPTAAWGVADAGRKLEDVVTWSAEIGGFDALAVANTDDTVSPASILQLGLPVRADRRNAGHGRDLGRVADGAAGAALAAMSLTADLAPGPNTAIGLHLPGCPCGGEESHITRVESVTATHLVVATPHDHGTAPSGDMIVSWARGSAGIQLPTRVVETRSAPFPTWVVEPSGPPVRIQRRQYVRVLESDGSADLRLFTADGVVPAEVVDLSEGGTRCTVPATFRPTVGAKLEAGLGFDGSEITVHAVVVRIHPRTATNELGLQFGGLSEHDADLLRHHVFAHQANLRSRAE